MLEALNIGLEVDAPPASEQESLHLLREVSLKVPQGHLMAIVGPSGCGKSTLLKVVAGILEQTAGDLKWEDKDLKEEEDLHPGELGYVPQFSVAHDLLTVEECVASSMALRTQLPGTDDFEPRLDQILAVTGLTELADRRVKVLSGGQKRRLGLALELVTNPCLLLCDEVTSGLDPKSEQEITELLRVLSRENPRRLVINVTHSLASLEAFDSVLVMYQGHLVYHGPPRLLNHYFTVEHPEDVYRRLTQREAQAWHESWQKKRSYYEEMLLEKKEDSLPADKAPESEEPDKKDAPQLASEELPGLFSQVFSLLHRRWTIFRRDRGQVWLHLAMLFGFPLLVVIFALDGIKPLQQLNQRQDADIIYEMQRQAQHQLDQLNAGSIVSGLIMLQVVLVTLMASNNAAREIAGERLILEREKLGGLSTTAYVMSKVLFLGVFVLAQSLWMGVFVDMVVGGLPGDLIIKLVLLVLASAAMTSICLGISALSRTPEKATILSIYLVGFQLPLSGAVLSLPSWLEGAVNPFIAAFWSWSGSLRSMSDTAFYEAVKQVTDTSLVSPELASFVLLAHVIIGLCLTYVGSRNSQWE
ncbi:ABC-type multidrug transport system, ATPase component [Prosthecobacter debontii]|uniref:ABC-type multidrug transport system, ATPase component n=1 Tax=Prosthecobacter debontii TaxID=48467 RepID=A0A1T4Y5K0_9BACT|nr:ATP-binding cassette domain-containing protein [Prosthecobacter debontii]SKA97049.1 ABC-type multidrug transport system, ATPase component [Prosthecobacter debontii]